MKGNIRLLSVGFGLQQAWTYSVMFSTAQLFRSTGNALENQLMGGNFVNVVSIIAFSITLLFIGLTDQRFLRLYTQQRTILVAAILAFIGTLAMFGAYAQVPYNIVFGCFAGVIAGIGSGLLLPLWGTAFSRHGADSIILNSVIGIALAFVIYFTLIHLIPPPASGIIASLLPLIEIPLLWHYTPPSYALRHVKPIFDAFPLNKSLFSLQLALTMLFLGFAFGMIRSVAIQIVMPSGNHTIQLLGIIVGSLLSLSSFILVFTTTKHDHWNYMFRVIIPSVAISLIFLAMFVFYHSSLAAFLVLVGCMCFESLMWITFGVMAQEFHLSPLYFFGMGWGCLTLCSGISSLQLDNIVITEGAYSISSLLNLSNIIIFAAVGLVIALAILPRIHDACEKTLEYRYKTGDFDKRERIADASQDAPTIKIPESVLVSAEELVVNNPEKAIPANTVVTTAPENDISEASVSSPPHTEQSSSPQTQASPEVNEPDSAANTQEKPRVGSFRHRCEVIAKRYLLSSRESEIFVLLAKGYNAARIKDDLYVSLSTVKTHINHIYHKLDIHTQQELLRMVDDVDEQEA